MSRSARAVCSNYRSSYSGVAIRSHTPAVEWTWSHDMECYLLEEKVIIERSVGSQRSLSVFFVACFGDGVESYAMLF